MFDWQRVSKAQFERVAEGLIRRSGSAKNPGLDVKAVDGRGGDGGIDLDVTVKSTGQLVAIYQLKHFPEGFSGGWAKTRKDQIRRSFESAMKHAPESWYLVMPRNLTPKERSFLRSLKGKSKALARLSIRYLGAGELDDLLVEYPEFEDWVNRSSDREALKLVQRESAALSKPGDLGVEVFRLGKRVAAESDYWRRDFSLAGGVYTETVTALRPDAEEREPLRIETAFDFGTDEELRKAFEFSMDYGVAEKLVLPGDAVVRFEKRGPEWFAGPVELERLELHPSDEPLQGEVRVALFDREGRQLASRTSNRARFVAGSKGGQLIVPFVEGMTMAFVAHRDDDSGRTNVTLDIAGRSATDGRKVVRFLRHLESVGAIEVSAGSLSIRVTAGDVWNPIDPRLVALVEDLAVLEDKLDVQFSLPDELPKTIDRIWARIYRYVLEGKPTLAPVESMNFTLNGELDDGLRLLLQSTQAAQSRVDNWEVELFGARLDLGAVAFWHPEVRAKDGEEHLQALERGEGEDRQVQLFSADGVRGFVVFTPGKLQPDERIIPTPWDVPGALEHRQLRSSG